MGRGRAKAKQTKVARELKYSSGGTDLDALRKELASASPPAAPNGGSSGSHGPSSTFEDDQDIDEDADDLGDSYGASTR
jgi:hypothetical protein